MSRYTEFEVAALQRAKAAATRTSTLRLIAMLGKSLVADLQRAARGAAVRRELGVLDARTLADIGVESWEIEAIAAEVAGIGRESVPTTGRILAELLWRRPRAWAAKRKAYGELMALDDRLLSDIGVARGDIGRVVYGAAQAEPIAPEAEDDIVDIIRQWNRSRAAAKVLKSLDDRTLADIGFVRGDIDWVSAELANRSVHPAHAKAA
jgi:uncharacterized protein YjiS (DUF1127 family)